MKTDKLINEFGPYTYEPTCDRVVGDVEIKNDELLHEFDQYVHATSYEYLKRWDCVLGPDNETAWIQTDKKTKN